MNSDFTKDRAAVVPSTEVWFELRKILRSKDFRRSPTLRRFLCFVVEESIAGRGNRLTEFVVGVQVFRLPTSYDPRLDSRVRVEAHRLRAALTAYYAEQGRNDATHIELSTGSYAPFFRHYIGPEPQHSCSVEEDLP